MTVINQPQKPLLGKLRIQSTLTVETGLHIGGGAGSLDIGGIDKPVVRDPVSQQPYLPGSSLKGKLRSILERILNKQLNRSGGGVLRYESDDLEDGYTNIGNADAPRYVEFQGAKTCTLSRIFGSTGSQCFVKEAIAQSQDLDRTDNKTVPINNQPYVKIRGRNAPARLIVRDSHLLTDSAKQLKAIDTGLYMTEWKFENSIDRITAAANPRQFERVPAGAQFKFEMVYTIEDPTQVAEDIQNLAITLAILEDDALGGHGSRGYGKVKFTDFEFFYRSVEQYKQLTAATGSALASFQQFDNTDSLLQRFAELETQVKQQIGPGAN